MTGRPYLKDYEPLSDHILGGLIGKKVNITHGGVSDCGLWIVDVGRRSVWVQRGEEPLRAIDLNDIVTLTYEETVRHKYRNPNINLDEEV